MTFAELAVAATRQGCHSCGESRVRIFRARHCLVVMCDACSLSWAIEDDGGRERVVMAVAVERILPLRTKEHS